jgi:ABC-type Fe3+-hydroxamate transport system substrate-binding protein
MKRPIYFTTIACIVLVSGCASIEPALKSNAIPDSSSSYIAGSFTRKSSGGFAFAITNLQTNREYSLSLGEDTFTPKDIDDQVVTIQVPPGRYMVSSWYTYGTLNKAKNSTNKITNPYLSSPFEVSSNSVLFLGRFAASTSLKDSTITYLIKPERITLTQAREAFFSAYPSFKDIALSCKMCGE